MSSDCTADALPSSLPTPCPRVDSAPLLHPDHDAVRNDSSDDHADNHSSNNGPSVDHLVQGMEDLALKLFKYFINNKLPELRTRGGVRTWTTTTATTTSTTINSATSNTSNSATSNTSTSASMATTPPDLQPVSGETSRIQTRQLSRWKERAPVTSVSERYSETQDGLTRASVTSVSERHSDTQAGLTRIPVTSDLDRYFDTQTALTMAPVTACSERYSDTQDGLTRAPVTSDCERYSDTQAHLTRAPVISGNERYSDTQAGLTMAPVTSDLEQHSDTQAGLTRAPVTSDLERYSDTQDGLPRAFVTSVSERYSDTQASLTRAPVTSGCERYSDTQAGCGEQEQLHVSNCLPDLPQGSVNVNPGSGTISSVTLSSPGSGTISSMTVSSPGSGTISSMTVSSPGSGTISSMTVSSPGSGMISSVTDSSPVSGMISSMTVSSPGRGMISSVTVSSPGSGTISSMTVSSPGSGKISSVTLSSHRSGMISSVNVSPGSGKISSMNVNPGSGKISSVNVNHGSGKISSMTLSSPDSGMISSVNVNPGRGSAMISLNFDTLGRSNDMTDSMSISTPGSSAGGNDIDMMGTTFTMERTAGSCESGDMFSPTMVGVYTEITDRDSICPPSDGWWPKSRDSSSGLPCQHEDKMSDNARAGLPVPDLMADECDKKTVSSDAKAMEEHALRVKISQVARAFDEECSHLIAGSSYYATRDFTVTDNCHETSDEAQSAIANDVTDICETIYQADISDNTSSSTTTTWSTRSEDKSDSGEDKKGDNRSGLRSRWNGLKNKRAGYLDLPPVYSCHPARPSYRSFPPLPPPWTWGERHYWPRGGSYLCPPVPWYLRCRPAITHPPPRRWARSWNRGWRGTRPGDYRGAGYRNLDLNTGYRKLDPNRGYRKLDQNIGYRNLDLTLEPRLPEDETSFLKACKPLHHAHSGPDYVSHHANRWHSECHGNVSMSTVCQQERANFSRNVPLQISHPQLNKRTRITPSVSYQDCRRVPSPLGPRPHSDRRPCYRPPSAEHYMLSAADGGGKGWRGASNYSNRPSDSQPTPSLCCQDTGSAPCRVGYSTPPSPSCQSRQCLCPDHRLCSQHDTRHLTEPNTNGCTAGHDAKLCAKRLGLRPDAIDRVVKKKYRDDAMDREIVIVVKQTRSHSGSTPCKVKGEEKDKHTAGCSRPIQQDFSLLASEEEYFSESNVGESVKYKTDLYSPDAARHLTSQHNNDECNHHPLQNLEHIGQMGQSDCTINCQPGIDSQQYQQYLHNIRCNLTSLEAPFDIYQQSGTNQEMLGQTSDYFDTPSNMVHDHWLRDECPQQPRSGLVSGHDGDSWSPDYIASNIQLGARTRDGQQQSSGNTGCQTDDYSNANLQHLLQPVAPSYPTAHTGQPWSAGLPVPIVTTTPDFIPQSSPALSLPGTHFFTPVTAIYSPNLQYHGHPPLPWQPTGNMLQSGAVIVFPPTEWATSQHPISALTYTPSLPPQIKNQPLNLGYVGMPTYHFSHNFFHGSCDINGNIVN